MPNASGSEEMSGTVLAKCSPCKPGPAAEYQDKLYKGLRVHNWNMKGEAVCTCCSSKKRRDDAPKPKKAK